MKYTLNVFIFLLLNLKIFAQTSKDEFSNMIDSALKMRYTKISEKLTKGEDIRNYFENLYLLNSENRSLNYLPISKSIKFNYIDVLDKRNEKIVEKGIRAWKVISLLDGNKFTINIIDFAIRLKNRIYNFSNGGGAMIIFEYDCVENVWKLNKFENKGI
ncbi:MAG TPA: hypothetical protein VK772_11735 [Puia sp.]|jgi:hypothetical protein|nr:hypothetical protein [Puia sp.]